jgi:hypothetical protein
MSSKYKNKRRAIQENYLSICMYFSAIIFQMQISTYILFRAAELPGQSVYMENIYLA